MIKKIDIISNFAIFDNFNWNSQCRDSGNNIAEFKKLNIIYGRNYSGKTTLSRIFRSFEKGSLPVKYQQAQFRLSHSGSEAMSHDNLNSHPYNIRVYNEDFKDEHLGWLKDEHGSISPFAVMGEKNVEIEKQIKEKEKELGNEEQKTGLRQKLTLKEVERNKKTYEIRNTTNALDGKLRNKANDDIKRNSLYENPTYFINEIKLDINLLKIHPREVLTETEIEEKKKLLREQAKNNISQVQIYTPNFLSIYQETQNLLGKKITPTKPIQDLLNNAMLQEWVRQGVGHHKNKRDKCAFCGGNLSVDLWDKLDSHFNRESETLREEIQEHISTIEDEKNNISKLLFPKKAEYYSIFHPDYERWSENWDDEKRNYISMLKSLIQALGEREKDIFNTRIVPVCKDNSDDIIDLQNRINDLISTNNQKTITLMQDQSKARNDLRLDEVARFIKDIGYDEEQEKINILQEAHRKVESEYRSIQENIEKLESEIEEFKNGLKDERKGADKVNEYLNHFFGHEGLKLVAEDQEGDVGCLFKIMRNSELAFNLSEGERSLIAICYFMAKLDDINTSGKNPIIWIDDPVSSLDSNHIFFVFSLIESVIAKPIKKADGANEYKYQQLFISTHNLDFLKYLKRLSMPAKQSEFFVVERTETNSRIALMPDYLKKYVTEFNYLFHQIYKCSKTDSASTGHDCFYNFGNNLRKFLEAYLFYKYPVYEPDSQKKLEMFFGNDSNSVALTNRLINELSHLEHIFDRSMRPMEIPEIPKLATFVMETIKTKDPEQYNALMKSIGEAT